MKNIQIPTLFFLCALNSSCSLVGLHTSRQVEHIKKEARAKGVADGRAIESRTRLLAEKSAMEAPQATSTFYSIPVAPHTTSDGIQIEEHETTVEIINR